MQPFKLENFFDKWEFKTPYLLCCSDNETLSMKELIALADTETAKLWEELALGYTHVSGHPLLKKEIAKLYENVDEKGVGTFAGAGEAVFAALSVLVQPRDHVIVPYPCYQTLAELPKKLGAEVSAFPIRKNEGGWYFDCEDLIQLVRPNTRVIVINFPHNPTSVHIDRHTLEKIVAAAKRANAYIVSDEVYRFSEQPPSQPLPPAADLYEKAISIGVMSKTLGLPGTRIGWIATQNQEILKKSLEFKCYISLCNSAPSEILSIMGLRVKDKIIRRNLGIIHDNLNLLDAFFHNYQDLFSWKRPLAGSTAFPELLLSTPIQHFC